ncbi:ATPase [Candidatus Falkowbacteria bacterium CG11_big_fil_rev_8_21_14_0_20_39_10]|uniref:ATPase n=1 Tax=Candidatus Falkowbacteria bacterium CG11_big_fil_rev_8_21_14_0_20_39_10 TaxID=1974570 RepID=A0A2M6K855_9BACT|nr:MAG: ATPase [Candidatus Falkowbacteria bacterium CG11_big_fil_rev_8_21_14_0_20_39_10]
MIKKYIKRKIYLEKIGPFIDKDIIKVIVGQRRVGKSYLLFQIMDLIKEKHKQANVIYINKELNEFDKIKNYQDLLTHIKKSAKGGGKNYVFIDEIQDIDKFEKALRSLKASGRHDIYCTGSNAHLLSGELATYLSGRYIEIQVFGLSYPEFLTFHKLENSQDSLLKYIKYGGLPYLKHLELNDLIVYDYLRNVYNAILYKDVVSRHKIRNPAFLESLIEYLADNTGSLVSAKKVSDFLKSQKINISPNIVLDYLSFLVNAFFISKTPRADIQGKKIFEINDKYYFKDLGLRHAIIGYKQVDISKILENLVFLHLQTAGYKIFVGKLGNKEVDFVCEKQGKKIYVQTAYLITDKNKEREFGNLLAVKDNYPKIVVSMDEFIDRKGYRGIEHIHIRDFLSSVY